MVVVRSTLHCSRLTFADLWHPSPGSLASQERARDGSVAHLPFGRRRRRLQQGPNTLALNSRTSPDACPMPSRTLSKQRVGASNSKRVGPRELDDSWVREAPVLSRLVAWEARWGGWVYQLGPGERASERAALRLRRGASPVLLQEPLLQRLRH